MTYRTGRLLGVILALCLGACGSTERVRYRMTVEVETPAGLRTGSSVREVVGRTAPNIPMLGEDRGSVSVRGEAVAVDLPGGQVLYALLDGADTVPLRIDGQLTDQVIPIWPTAPVGIHNPDGTARPPQFVRFRDPRDPRSVEAVDPVDFAASFGPGTRLRRITIQHTDADVTTGIERRLAWLPGLHGSYLHGGSTSRGSPLGLYGGNFSSESFQ
jgi:hypothetical protein